MSEKFTLFWGGPASQWHPSPFKLDGMDFNCAEQYMMFAKAVVFADYESMEKIMATDSPSTQKALGRKVKGFDKDVWEVGARSLVYAANWAKFTQNPDLWEWLKSTAGTTLVEASPYDKIWGIGLSEEDPRCLDRNLWQGTNWLGEVVTQVREDIFKKNGEQTIG